MSFSYICVKKRKHAGDRKWMTQILWIVPEALCVQVHVVEGLDTVATNNYCCFAREYLPFIRLRRLTNKITKEGVCVRECGPRGSSKDQKQTSWKNTMTVRFWKMPPSNNPSRGLANASCIINFPCYWWDTDAQEPRFVSETRHGRQSSRLRNSEGVFSFVH